jgi:hypothetical protein
MRTVHGNISQSTSEARTLYRDRIDLLRSRVSMLSGKDKLLMTMYLENGNTFRQMARLAGVNEANIARKVHRITKQLLDGKYITCLRNSNKFTKTELAVAKDSFLLGLSQKRIAAKRRCRVHQIRASVKRIKQIVATLEEGKNSSRC